MNLHTIKALFFGILALGLGAAAYFHYPSSDWGWFLFGSIFAGGMLYDLEKD